MTSFFADLLVVKRNLRPCSLFAPDSGRDHHGFIDVRNASTTIAKPLPTPQGETP